MNLVSTTQYTAAQIANALGKNPRVVRRWLGTVKPSGEIVVRGNVTAAFSLESLPAHVQQELKIVARVRGYASVEDFLNGRVETWKPEIDWNEVCPEQQSAAIKLQRALLPALTHWREASAAVSDYAWRSDANLLLTGIRAYEKEFGGKVSEAHWQYLFGRSLERGAAHRDHPELFLSGNLKRPAESAPVVHADEFAGLHDLIFNKCAAPTALTTDEKAKLWQRVFQCLQPLSGREFKFKRLRLLKFLWSAAPCVAASKNSLRMTLDRMMARGKEGGGLVEAFSDGREARLGIPTAEPYDPEQVALIKVTAADYTLENRAMAARDLNEAGLITDPRIKRSLDTATSKSYLPASLRAQLKDVSAWRVLGLDERNAAKLTPRMKLSYDGISSMLCLVPDDHTPDLYVAVPDGKGWFDVMRPQLILIADFRSHLIVGRGIIPAPYFTANDVLAPFKRVFMKFGQPAFILREGGKIFRGSKLVNSMTDMGTGGAARQGKCNNRIEHPFSAAEIEYGLERAGTTFCESAGEVVERLGNAGIQFREAYQANAKPVEGIIGHIAKIIARLPGYCGNNERLNCKVKTTKAIAAVRSRKFSPAYPVTDPKTQVEMLTWNQWVETVDLVIAKYNSTPQEGDKLRNPLTRAPMSPEEAFEVFTNLSDPPNHTFGPESAAYMSRMQIPVEVKKPNVRRRNFNCGFVEIMGNTYCDGQTGARIGQKLLAFYDPDTPEVCTFTNMNRDMRSAFTVARLESPNALFIDEQTKISRSQAQRTISGVRADYKAAAVKFTPLIRQQLVAPLVKSLNEHIQKETVIVQQKQRRKAERGQTIARRAGNIPVRAGLLENSEQNLRAVDGIAKAKRLRELEKQREKTL